MQDFRMETFLTVCKYLNYTKAAQELNLTQPAVSQHIRYLENFYQVQLLPCRKKSGTDQGGGAAAKFCAYVQT